MNFFDKCDDTRAQNGIGSQLNIWDETLQKYVLFIPLETVPSVVGSTNTSEVDLLTSASITKIEGKSTVDDKDVTFLWHRDNLRRLRQYAGKQCKFLVSYPDYTGWTFEGKIIYKPDDGTSDKLTGTFTIIANKVGEREIEDVRPMMAKTCFITSTIPFELVLGASKTQTINLSATSSSATFTAESSAEGINASITGSQLTITGGASASYGIVTIKSSASGMASWETTIAVEVVAE